MRRSGFGIKSLMGNLVYVEQLLGNMERHGTEQHVKNAVKECLLASRSVIDSFIDVVEGEQGTSAARKINISEE